MTIVILAELLPCKNVYFGQQLYSGNSVIPGGLRFHGMNPMLSELYHQNIMRAVSVKQTEVFKSAVEFARIEEYFLLLKAAVQLMLLYKRPLTAKKPESQKIFFLVLLNRIF